MRPVSAGEVESELRCIVSSCFHLFIQGAGSHEPPVGIFSLCCSIILGNQIANIVSDNDRWDDLRQCVQCVSVGGTFCTQKSTSVWASYTCPCEGGKRWHVVSYVGHHEVGNKNYNPQQRIGRSLLVSGEGLALCSVDLFCAVYECSNPKFLSYSIWAGI
jgi:hypothetical protein